MQIQIRINEEGALRNQRHAFSNRYTLVSELLQNARRADATCIHIDHDAARQVLTVHDDGRGLDDLQKLLTFHESGWEEAIATEERPFGVGFSKCLYAATHCVVASGHRRIAFDTTDALAKAMIEVEERIEGEAVNGTRVELLGVELPDLAGRIEELCAGFAMPVWFNGSPLKRPLAEAHLATQPSAIGSVHLAGTRDGKYAHDTWVFLQGFCVLRPVWSSRDPVNVVHLDSRQFMARLPDRDRLIDEDIHRKRIDAELKACWRRELELARTQLPPERFVELFYPAMRAWGQLDLMNDLDVLPAKLCDSIVGYPVQDEHGDRGFRQAVDTTLTRHDIETGAVQLVALDAVGDTNGARWMLARAKRWLVLDWLGVHADHWSLPHVRFLEDEPVRVTPFCEHLRTVLDGRWVCPTVILSQLVCIQVGPNAAMIADAGVSHEGCLYIPDGETTGRPVQQLSSFTDEHDQFLDADRDADCEALADLLQLLRSVDPVQTLESLLKSLRLNKYPLLHGKTFRLTVGVGNAPGYAVDLLEADERSARPASGEGGEAHARP